jgi:hypothetical protein
MNVDFARSQPWLWVDMVRFTPPSALSQGKESPIPTGRVAGQEPQPVCTIWKKEKYLGRSGGRTPDHPAGRLVTVLTTSLHDNMLTFLKPSVAKT